MWKILSIALLLSACGGDSPPSPRPPAPPAGKLFVFTDAHERQLKNGQYVTPEMCDIGRCYKVRFVPTSEGSPRIGKSFDFSRTSWNATLSYKIRIQPDFEFVLGGKLNGLRPKNAANGGCECQSLSRWSTRVMWNRNQSLDTYTYHKDQVRKWGDHGQQVSTPVINDGKWHTIELKLAADVKIYVDGQLVATQENFERNTPVAGIFITMFYGGQTLKYAPSKPQEFYFAQLEVK